MAGGPSRRQPLITDVERLDPSRFLPFVPTNEQGVVYLFALAAQRLGFEVEKIRTPFPDCSARWRGRRILIEFEYRSRNFEQHGHDPGGCELIVCWKHDWADLPPGLAVLELRKLFGHVEDVFVIAYHDNFWRDLPSDRSETGLWSVPASSGPGDLLLVYRPAVGDEQGAITDVFEVMTPVERVGESGWREEPDWMASIRRVARLGNWLSYSRMKELGIHGGIESRPKRTGDWSTIHDEIVGKCNPSHSLKRWAPVEGSR